MPDKESIALHCNDTVITRYPEAGIRDRLQSRQFLGIQSFLCFLSVISACSAEIASVKAYGLD